jgi:hypothetical protein
MASNIIRGPPPPCARKFLKIATQTEEVFELRGDKLDYIVKIVSQETDS